nr:MAG TPA: ubiquitin-binding zinc finger protein [Caudoviricetes sp.]
MVVVVAAVIAPCKTSKCARCGRMKPAVRRRK